MIHYHGGPITPLPVAHAVWAARHAFVSFERPEQVGFAAEICQSFALDNGAFSVWRQGGALDVPGYVTWVNTWRLHPGFDWALIPDVIDGSEEDNDAMMAQYADHGGDLRCSVPVWHLHERLDRLVQLGHTYPRVALGSSGQWATVGTPDWWTRMTEVMEALCNTDGQPPCKLHGLRMLNPAVFTRLPLASADSTNVARNHTRERRQYALTSSMGALSVLHRIESQTSASHWQPVQHPQHHLELSA